MNVQGTSERSCAETVPFTEGPWTAKPSEDGDTIWIGNDGVHACCVPGYTDHPGNKANAALVAAAPEMHAALTELLALCETMGSFRNGVEHDCMDESEVFASGIFDQARAALNKAKETT